jgi:type I restriction enzyme M protein
MKHAIRWCGAIVGDIAGSRFEFHNRKSKQFRLLVAKGQGPHPCKFTDDSVMTLAIADAIMNWRETNDASFGALSIEAIRSMQYYGSKYPRAGYGGSFRRWLCAAYPQPYNSWGNGSAMRASACGWAAQSLSEAVSLADAVTCVTHNHPEGMKGAEATATCVFLARTGVSKEEIRRHVEKNFYKIDFTLDEIRPYYDFDVSCQGSVPQALEAFFESKNFEDAIRNAVSIGGDSDTIAAVAGAVAGAFYGVPETIGEKALSFLDCFLGLTAVRFGAVVAPSDSTGDR